MGKTQTQIEIYNSLSHIAEQINDLIGPKVWDYAYLFNTANKNRIEFKSISIKAEELINKYINEVNSIRGLYELNALKGKDLSETFEQAMHSYFELRFLEAKSLFADYELLRIITDTEYRIMVASKEDLLELSDTHSIYIINSIKKNIIGDIDIDTTQEYENKWNVIKSYISYKQVSLNLAMAINIEFRDYTTMGVPTYVYNDEITKIFEHAIEIFMDFTIRSIYGYISKGYTLEQSRVNVNTYVTSILNKQELRLRPQFDKLEDEMIQYIQLELKKLKGLEDRTIEILKWEMLELIIDHYLKGKLEAMNYYDLEFRQADIAKEYESRYEYICDTYLLLNTTRAADFPIESYAITLTPDSKMKIFSYVTLGMENPNNRLEDVIDYF